MPCRTERTSRAFVRDGKRRPGIPQLVDSNDKFIELICKYLRQLWLVEKAKPNTVYSYSDRLLHWCNFIEARIKADARQPEALRLFGRAKNVSEALPLAGDRQLEAWLTEQEFAGKAPTTRQRRCDAFFHFYVWAQVEGLVKHRVKVPTVNADEDFKPAISSKLAKSGPDIMAAKYGVVSKLRPRVPKSERLHIPPDDEVHAIFAVIPTLFTPAIAQRNTLLAKWYVQTGVRRSEWVHLYMRNVPSQEAIDDALLSGLGINVKLEVTKSGEEQWVDPSAELLDATREYIDGPRAAIVKRFREKPGYKEPKEVFLSDTTGLALNERSVCNLLKGIFSAAKAKGTGHRLRASFLNTITVAETRAEEIAVVEAGGLKHAINHHNVTLRAAEKARHSSLASQERYVERVRKQRGKAQGHDELVSVHMEVQATRQELASNKAEVAAARKELAEVQAAVEKARKEKGQLAAAGHKRGRTAKRSLSPGGR